MKYNIFISYSRKDIEFAKSVCAVLDEFSKYYSFKYFFDTSAIKSREEYLNRIAGAIVESKTLLFIASQSAYESEFCAKELLFADKRSIPIHQYRIDDAKIPDVLDLLLGTHQYREADATSIESFVREVLADALGCEVLSLEEIKEQQRLRSLEQREQEEQKRQLQIAKEREMREKIEQLTSRRRDILAEIVECEKTLAGLNREKEFVEKDITTLRRSLGEDVQDESTDAKESGADVSAVTKPRGIKSILQTIWGWIKQGAVYYIIFNVVFLLFLWAVNSCEDETNPEPTDEVGIVVAEDKKADDCKISEVTVKQKANKVPQANADVDKSEAKKSSNNISTPKEPVAKDSSKSSKDVENPKAKDSSKTTSAAEKQVNKSEPSKSTKDVENKEAKVAPKTNAASDNKVDKFGSSKSTKDVENKEAKVAPKKNAASDNKVDKFGSSKSATAEKSAKTKSYKVGEDR